MLYDIEAYRKQKTRWARGNAQSIRTLFYLYGGIPFTITLRGQKKIFLRALKALIVHMGMTIPYSEALNALWHRRESVFERTNKFILTAKPSLIKNSRE